MLLLAQRRVVVPDLIELAAQLPHLGLLGLQALSQLDLALVGALEARDARIEVAQPGLQNRVLLRSGGAAAAERRRGERGESQGRSR